MQRHHAGYLQYLAAHPALATEEQAWWNLHRLAQFRALAHNHDLALRETPRVEEALDTFYAQASTGNLADAAEALGQRLNARGEEAPLLGLALRYVQEHPEAVMRLLRAGGLGGALPDTGALAEALRQYRARNPNADGDLRKALGALAATPAAQDRLGPWWSVVSGLQSEGPAHQALMEYFSGHPAHFWVWHRRNLALREDPHARAWIRWWLRRVDSEPALAHQYEAYLSTLTERQSLDQIAGPLESAGPEAWPPAGSPPELPTIMNKALPVAPGASQLRPQVNRPERPTVARPERPLRPERPTLRESTRFQDRRK